MRRKSHLLLIFGGIVFLIYYKWRSASDEHDLTAAAVDVDSAPEIGVEQETGAHDDFDNSQYYHREDSNDTSATGDFSSNADLALDHMQAAEGDAQQLAGSAGQEGGEQLHLDNKQEQLGAEPPPQEPAGGQEQPPVPQQNSEQQAPYQQQPPEQQQQQQQQQQPLVEMQAEQQPQILQQQQEQQQQQLQQGEQQPEVVQQQHDQDIQQALQQLPQNAQPAQPEQPQQQQLPA